MLTFSPNTVPEEFSLPNYALFIVRFMLFAVAHSLFAMDRTKQFTGRYFNGSPRFYRLGYNLTSLVMFAWVMSAYSSSPVLYFAPGIWSLVMYAAQLVVAIILFQCLRQTGAGDFLGTSQLRSDRAVTHRLVTSGFYARMRHPLYFYATVFLVLNPVMTAQWLILTLLSICYFIPGGLIEERRLLETYGDEYRHYQKNVPFLLPTFKPPRTTDKS